MRKLRSIHQTVNDPGDHVGGSLAVDLDGVAGHFPADLNHQFENFLLGLFEYRLALGHCVSNGVIELGQHASGLVQSLGESVLVTRRVPFLTGLLCPIAHDGFETIYLLNRN